MAAYAGQEPPARPSQPTTSRLSNWPLETLFWLRAEI